MCTHADILGISWWSIWIVIGVAVCLFVFDKLCAIRKVSSKANKFYYIVGIIAIVLGFLSASLVQSLYNYIDAVKEYGSNAKWEWGGVTFMGGMYGGAISFIVISLIFAKGEVRAQFGQVCEIGLTCIPTAHAFGRIGCFSVGCCYGAEVMEGDAFGFLGVILKHGSGAGVPRYPTQLFEAIFLFILAIAMFMFVVKGKKINSIVYFAGYGIFRFLLEFLRDDFRGSIGAVSLSPSQVLSIVSVCIALVMAVLLLINKYRPDIGKKIKGLFKLNVELPAVSVAQSETEEVAIENDSENEKENK